MLGGFKNPEDEEYPRLDGFSGWEELPLLSFDEELSAISTCLYCLV